MMESSTPVSTPSSDAPSFAERCQLGVDPLTKSSVDQYLREYDDSSFSSCQSDLSSPTDFCARLPVVNSLYPSKETVEELLPEEVRWFYREEGEKNWVSFMGYDSLRLECKHRELQMTSSSKTCSKDSSSELILVRGGLFEANVLAKTCQPIYWSGMQQSSELLRGTWFKDGVWQPLDETISAAIEAEHLDKFLGMRYADSQESEASSKSKTREPLHTLRLSDCHVDWYDLQEIFLYHDSASLFIRQRLGMQKTGARLRRGFLQEARVEDKLPDITHLVFVIHGIGQKMRTGAIVKCSFDLRQTCERIKERYFPDLDAANQRVEFLPVEWRSSLKLDGDTVDSITPPNIRGLRTLLNSSAMDILYYTSPLYRSEITHGLQTELSRLYSMFCARHPYFEANGGLVSIIAHSLGCVITYDIIMGWNPIQLYDHYLHNVLNEQDFHCATSVLKDLDEARKKVLDLELSLLSMAERNHSSVPNVNFRQANFPINFKSGPLWRGLPKIENLFCLGSPLAVFLALRGIRPKGNGCQDDIIPKSIVKRLFNVYHPADPVAYRLEPLILKHYSTIAPLLIHRADSLHKSPYHTLPQEPIVDGKMRKNQSESSLRPKSSATEDNFDEYRVNHTKSWMSDIGDEEIVCAQSDGLSGNRKTKRMNGFFSKWNSRKNQGSPRASKRSVDTLDSKDGISAELQSFPSSRSLRQDTGGSDTDVVSSVAESLRSESPALVYDAANERTELEHRLDFQLREGRYESSYLSVLTSHTGYWNNDDIAMFFMSNLFSEFGPIGIPKK